MKRNDGETDGSLQEYFARIEQRLQYAASSEQRLARVHQVMHDANHHIERLRLAERRFHRSSMIGDKIGAPFEHELMVALLYEAADHVFMALHILDFDLLDLGSTAHGYGLVGESALDVVQTFRILEAMSAHILARAKQLNIHLDFSHAVDEREGLSYVKQPHWQDFVPDSISESFRRYFEKVGKVIIARLAQRPRFWERQTIEQYLQARGCHSVLAITRPLERLVPISERVEASWVAEAEKAGLAALPKSRARSHRGELGKH